MPAICSTCGGKCQNPLTPTPGCAKVTRDRIAAYVGDNWPDKTYTLAEVESKLREIVVDQAPTVGT